MDAEVILACSEADERAVVVSEGGHPVAHAFVRLGDRLSDDGADTLELRPLQRGHGLQVLVEPTALHKDAANASAGELGLVLKIRENVRQVDVAFIQGHRRGSGRFLGIHAGAADGEVRLAPLQTGLGDGRSIGERFDADC